jgi:hypothetical protein
MICPLRPLCLLPLLTVPAGLSVQALAAAEPIALSDSLSGWMTPDGQPVPKPWRVSGGTIHLTQDGPRGGNIVSVREFGDFELEFWWKIAPGGNSGLKYRVRDFDGRVLGCEYQIVDDQAIRAGPNSKGSTGSLYDVYEPGSRKQVRPGEFNHARIVVRGHRIEHWLNGQLIVSALVGSSQWRERIADSKFADVDGFGENRRGRIMLTDHGSEVWFRDLVLQELPPPPTMLAACQPATACDVPVVCRPVIEFSCPSWTTPRPSGRRCGVWRLRRWFLRR